MLGGDVPGTRGAPHVVMVVANEVTPDARVKKTAATVANAGFDVTVLGVSRAGYRWTTAIRDVQIVRVPLESTYRSLAVPPAITRFRRALLKRSVERSGANKQRQRALLAIQNREFQARVVMLKERLRAIGVEEKQRFLEGQSRVSKARVLAVGASTVMRVRRRARMLPVRRQMAKERRLMERRRRLASVAETRLRRRQARAGRFEHPQMVSLSGVGSGWRSRLPELHDFEMAFGPVLDELAPDVIHAHDMAVIGIAARAAARLRGQGHDTRWIYDAHEYVRGLGPSMEESRWRAYCDLEGEFIGSADRIITVSDGLADRLTEDYRLEVRPTVVLNAPLVFTSPVAGNPLGLRERLRLDGHVPILVYSGRVDEFRGVDTLVAAMAQLPDVHVALVCDQRSAHVDRIVESAKERGVSDRLHVTPYVAPDQVVAHLASATVGVNLLLPGGNHDVALPNKFFEYLHAGLPILNADVGVSAKLVRDRGIGEVFQPGDPQDLAAAATRLLADRQRYLAAVVGDREFLRRMSWSGQEGALMDVYRSLVGDVPAGEGRAEVLDLTERDVLPPIPPDATARLLITPSNMAGQGMAWADSLQRTYPTVHAEVHAIRRGRIDFPADVQIELGAWRDPEWQSRQMDRVLERFSHVLIEGGATVAGGMMGAFFAAELPLLEGRGIRVGVVFHGSDIRCPRRHQELEPHSPFGKDAFTRELQEKVDRVSRLLQSFGGPVFVATNDLLDHVPQGEWLPVVVDMSRWTPPDTPALVSKRPVVAHLATQGALKGSTRTVEVCSRLAAEGVIEFRSPVLVPRSDLPAFIAGVDVFIDGTVLGDYGVTACQAMAMNRLVIGNVSARVRDRIPIDVPIAQATPDDLDRVLRTVSEDPTAFSPYAAAGRQFVQEFHDGTRAADVLNHFLVG